ncbi:hypothetical protein L596_023645 [Steinernema carpocapsae]|uniref:Glycylpeptide N-tetradecanoyltransferase n=1 Tax=Steinernema carpocapsae TaxID=34508 RepID=A0A4U5ME88_STECR|nr:hypothetical protein L596_023645 [Steinernema carpocapsae]
MAENNNEDVKKLTETLNNLQTSTTAAKDLGEAMRHQYKFWETQPVPKIDEIVTENNFIEPNVDVSTIRAEPYTLPKNFVWCDLDIDAENQLHELYQLLNENYVEDDDNMFRFDYSPEFLKWALKPPGFLRKWHCGVRVATQDGSKGKLLAFISAIPVGIRVYDKSVKMVEINFLCVHKKLRSKRVAPVLIREITRRVNQEGVFQAAFTAGIVIPKPIAQCRYYHRLLNPKKLVECDFSHLQKNMTMKRTIRLHSVPTETKTPGLKAMTEAHIDGAFELLTTYLKNFQLVPVYSREDFVHFFLPRDKVVYSYVVEKDGKVTDFVSFYNLPSTIMRHEKHKELRAAYAYYNVATSISLTQLMQDALIIAKQLDFDVFNALNLMENDEFLEELKFGIGDGTLQYYLYNWKCPNMNSGQVGLVLQ